MKRFMMVITLVIFASGVLATQASAQEAQTKSLSQSLGVFVYPGQGQTPEQQQADENECYGWAGETTGIDPFQPGQSGAAEVGGIGGSGAKGAARGAVGGAAISGMTGGDTSDAMLVGTAVGAVRGRRKAKKAQEAEKQQAEAAAKTADQERLDTFNRAFSACMEGRDYTVS
jgi:hypothetical protein